MSSYTLQTPGVGTHLSLLALSWQWAANTAQ